MVARPPRIAVGDPVEAIDTPALVVDLDRLDSNIARMARYAAAHGIRLRPHFKTHKCVAIARRQLAAGAIGLCCQKVSEAEILVAGGISDVLVTNEIFVPAKLDRLMQLTQEALIGVCVDSVEILDRLRHATRSANTRIAVYIELDVGAGRCGVEESDKILDLAKRIAEWPAFEFGGFQAYHGRAQHLRTPRERSVAITAAAARVEAAQQVLSRHSMRAPTVTGGGTGTFTLEASSRAYHEIQPGSYVFMDRDYADNERDETEPEFAHSLSIHCTVQSRRATHAVVDAGHKAHTIDSGMPAIDGRSDLAYERPSDEHGSIVCRTGNRLPALGDVLRLIPGHCDPTVNLYDWIICVRAGKVADVWRVDGRGAVT
jgi:D-serine deaminase-like pyridoxal phosphate-dependent protein